MFQANGKATNQYYDAMDIAKQKKKKKQKY